MSLNQNQKDKKKKKKRKEKKKKKKTTKPKRAACAPREDSYQAEHPHTPVRVYNVRLEVI